MNTHIRKTNNRQRGNVLFFIFIAVALFAALSYAVSNGMRGGGDTITKEQAKVAASEIMRKMQDIRRGYKYLMEQGCSVDDIQFDETPVANVDCQIFHVNGGGVTYPTNLEKHQVNPIASQIGKLSFQNAPDWTSGGQAGNIKHVGVGTDDQDILGRLNFVSNDICVAFNKLAGHNFSATPTENSAAFGTVSPELIGKEAACALKTNNTPNINQISVVLAAF